jgi:hypothetical protein
MKHILFARIAWHPRYDGKYPVPYTGADWKEKQAGRFGEWHNFSKFKGMYYGHVKPSKHWTADLKNTGALSGAKSVNGITVIWVALDPSGGSKVVGWYKNVTMYSELQKRPRPLDEDYLFKAKVSDCVLVDEFQRTFEIKKQFRGLWYAKDEKSLKRKVLKYIEKYSDDIDKSAKNNKQNRGQGKKTDPYKRQKVEEAAITKVTNYFEKLGYTVDSVEKDNVGWDLEARLKDDLLKLEVKGLSQDNVLIELTPNEYKKMKEYNDSYKICVVNNALRKKPLLKIFSYSQQSSEWKDEQGNELKITEKLSAQMSIK